jgi:hypothetical protein
MKTPPKTLLLLGLAALVAGLGHLNARAAGSDCSAHMGGIESGKRSNPVLTVFNAQDVMDPVDIDVVMRDADGTVLLSLEDALALESFQSGSVNLFQEYASTLPRRTKPYQGLVSVVVTSDSQDFVEDRVLIHTTQYIGNVKRPKSGLLFPAVFRDESAP